MSDLVHVSEGMIDAARVHAPSLNHVAVLRLLQAGLGHRREILKAAYLIAPSLSPAVVDAMLDAALVEIGRPSG